MTDSPLHDTEIRRDDANAFEGRASEDLARDGSRLNDEIAALIRRKPSDLPLFSKGRYKKSTALTPPSSDVAFIYWRHSTDEQVTSEHRQVIDCTAYAAKIRRPVDGIFGDAGKSGTSMSKRVGLHDMMAQVRARRPKLVIIEDLDRLSRKIADLLAIYSELTMLNVELHDIAHGKLDLVHVVIRGFMGEEGRVRFLSMSASAKRKAVANGRLMHKPAYGYRRHNEDVGVHVKDDDDHGGTSSIVRMIFEMAASGTSARAIARELTRRNLPTPGQLRLARRSGAVAKFTIWTKESVIRLVRNYLYCGFVCWGMESNGEEVVVELTELAIVDRDLWTKANLRFGEVKYGFSATNGRRYLLTEKAVCGLCGSALVSFTAGKSRYICSRRLDGGTCCARAYVRVDWLESAVLRRIFCEAVDDHGIDRYAKRLRKELPAILKDDLKRRRAIEHRLERIDDLLLRAYEDERQGVISSQVAKKIRRRMDEESRRLEKELASVKTATEYVIGLDAMDALAANYARMLAEVPFRPDDAEGMALAQSFRDVISRVVVHQPDATDEVRVVIELDPFFRLRDAERDDRVEGFGALTLETSFNRIALRREENRRRNDLAYRDIDAAALSGRHAISDALWTVAEPFVSTVGYEVAGVDASRKLMNCMLWLACGGGRYHKIVGVFGAQNAVQGAIRRLIYSGAWDELVAAFQEAGAPFVNDLVFFDRMRFRRRGELGGRPDAATAAADRQRLLEAAKRAKEGSIVRKRCEVVAAVLGGALTVDAARLAGVSNPAAYNYWRLYMEEGVDRLTEARRPARETKLSSPNVAKLRQIAQAGVDPDNPGRAFTTKVIRRLVWDRFGVSYSHSGMRQLMARHGFDLSAYHVRARREGRLGRAA